MAAHSSVLVWRIPGTGKPGGLPSMGSHRVGHDWSDLAAAAATAAAAMENSMEIQYGSVKSRPIISSHIWVFTQKNWSGSRRDTCTPQVDCSGIQNSQDREATQVSTERWMGKETVVYTHKGILFCLKKKKEVLLFATAWGDLEDIILSEISQTQKDQHCMILHAWNLKSWTCRSRE